jgi:hypothetical protein
MAADPELRRLMNQAIFTRLFIRSDSIEGEEQPTISQIRNLAPSRTLARANRPQDAQDPLSSGGLGSNVSHMVPRAGLEPAPPD